MKPTVTIFPMILLPSVRAFPLAWQSSSSTILPRAFHRSHNAVSFTTGILAKSKSDGDSGPGMEDAFRQLEKLQSLDDDSPPVTSDNDDETSKQRQQQQKRKDEVFAEAMKEFNLKDILPESSTPASPESEAELYKDMASELSAASSEDDLIADVKNDLALEDVVVERSIDAKSQKFMDQAIQEALQEAKEKNSDVEVDKESLLDNKEIMAEIEKIFDKANEQLLEGLEEIRSEQMALARETAERNAKASQAKIEEDEQRLAMAESNMKKMLSKVNEETRNVEAAIQDLQRAQEEADAGLDGQLSNLKSGGLVKQATLAGAVLFTMRSGVETIGFLGGDPSHTMPALIQGALAILCFVAFLVL